MLCIASNTCTASVVEICSSDAVGITTVVLIYEIQEVGETIVCKYLDNSLLEDSFSYNNSLLEDSFSCQIQTGFDQEYISLSFDADLFSQKVEGMRKLVSMLNARAARLQGLKVMSALSNL